MNFTKWCAKHPALNTVMYVIMALVSYYMITDYNYMSKIIGGIVLVIATVIGVTIECKTYRYINNQTIDS